MAQTSVTLNNGRLMPILGLGTYGCPKGEIIQPVKDAIDIGYRHIDCAHVYENEDDIGVAIAAKIQEGVVKREDLFVTSKLWNTYHRPDLVRTACENSLKELQLDYLDLYLIHWPTGYAEGKEFFPVDESGKPLYTDVDYIDTWQAMEKLVIAGLCKSIGLSNFNHRQVERILAIATIPPVVNQVECHPYLTQKKLKEYCESKNIFLTAYSPLGAPNRSWAKEGEPVLIEDPKILAIAEKYKRTPAQILIRYQIERGVIVIPKSATKSRIASNFDVFDFKLCAPDIATIDSFNANSRYIPRDSDHGHPHHPFEHDEY